MYDMDPQDDFGGNVDTAYSNEFPSALPPSGPSATQKMWFDHGVVAADSETIPDGGIVGGEAPPGNLPGSGIVREDVDEQASPLAKFDALKNSLPDIAGKGVPTTTE